jgi:hypothetical protein
MAQITVEELIDIAFAVEEGDPFDWAAFKQGREQAMSMIASSILEQFNKDQFTEQDIVIMLAAITKLVTENMILHTKLSGRSDAL